MSLKINTQHTLSGNCMGHRPPLARELCSTLHMPPASASCDSPPHTHPLWRWWRMPAPLSSQHQPAFLAEENAIHAHSTHRVNDKCTSAHAKYPTVTSADVQKNKTIRPVVVIVGASVYGLASGVLLEWKRCWYMRPFRRSPACVCVCVCCTNSINASEKETLDAA